MKNNPGLLIWLCLLALDRLTKYGVTVVESDRGMGMIGYSNQINSYLTGGFQLPLAISYMQFMVISTIGVCLWSIVTSKLTTKTPAYWGVWCGAISNLADWFIWGGTSDPLYIRLSTVVVHFNLADLYLYTTIIYLSFQITKTLYRGLTSN